LFPRLEKNIYTKEIVVHSNETKLPVKHIYLAENYDINDSESSKEFTDSLQKIAEIAVKRLKEDGLKFEPVLSVNGTDSTLEKFNPERIWGIIDRANEGDALAIIGFGWSTMAAIAAKRTNELKIPFLSPTAVVKDVFNGEYSNSFGLPVWDAAKGVKKLYERLEKPNLLVVPNMNNIQEVEYSQEVSKLLPEAHTVSYKENFPVSEILRRADELGDNTVVFVPGYTNLSEYLFEIGKVNKKITFIVGPQWPDEFEVLNGLENDVFCISDFSNLVRDTKEYEFFSTEFEKSNMDIPCIFFFKVYDALMSVLKAINKNPEIDRKELNEVLKNLGEYNGVLGTYEFKEGAIIKAYYILKFSDEKQGFELLEKIV